MSGTTLPPNCTGNELSASTCNARTGVSDTKISVYCGSCDDLTCVAGNDDDCDDFQTFASTVTWCSEPGVTYYISVGKFSAGTGDGDITLDVSDTGVACSPRDSCLSSCSTEDFDGGGLINGQSYSGGAGYTVSSTGANAGAAIFDSDPGGANAMAPDYDLLVGTGNILILQDDSAANQTIPGVFDDPGDDHNGGTLIFDFDGPVELASVDLIDIDAAPGIQDASVTLIDSGGNVRFYDVPTGWTALRLLWLEVEVDGEPLPALPARPGEPWDVAGPPPGDEARSFAGVPAGSRLYRAVFLGLDGEPTTAIWDARSLAFDNRLGPGESRRETFVVELAPGRARQVRARLRYLPRNDAWSQSRGLPPAPSILVSERSLELPGS